MGFLSSRRNFCPVPACCTALGCSHPQPSKLNSLLCTTREKLVIYLMWWWKSHGLDSHSVQIFHNVASIKWNGNKWLFPHEVFSTRDSGRQFMEVRDASRCCNIHPKRMFWTWTNRCERAAPGRRCFQYAWLLEQYLKQEIGNRKSQWHHQHVRCSCTGYFYRFGFTPRSSSGSM